MAFKIICGPAGSGKTHEAMRLFLEAAGKGSNPVYIAPSGPDAHHFERELLRRAGVLTRGKVTTFGNLCGDILKGAKMDLRIIGENEKKLLLRSIVDATDHLSFLKVSSAYPGFIDSLGKLIGELQGACIGPQQLATATTGLIPAELNSDLYRLYGNYRIALSEQEVTDEELAQCQAIESLYGDPSLLVYDTVIIDGFRDFTAIQRSMVTALENLAADLVLTAPCEEGAPATASVGEAFSEFMAQAECDFLGPSSDDARPESLTHLDRNLFREGVEKVPAGNAVSILEAAGVRGEAEMVAAEILKLCRAGRRLDDIAIVCRSLGPESTMMAAALDDFGVPYELNAVMPFASTPLGQTLLPLMDFVAVGMAGQAGSDTRRGPDTENRKNLLRYLSSSLPVADAAQVDMFAREARLHGIEDPHRLLEAWTKYGGRNLSEIADVADAAYKGTGELGAQLMAISRRLVSAGIKESDALGIDNPGSREQDLVALKMLQQVCDEAAKIGGSELSGPAALALLRSGLDAAGQFTSSGKLRGCVRILDPHRVLNQRFDVVFICGLLEGQFPIPGREDPFIPDAARIHLGEKGLDLRAKSNRLDEERFLFYRALTRANDRVYLTYPYCTSEGKEHVHSLFIDEVEEVIEVGPENRKRRTISEVSFTPGDAPTRKQALRSLCLEAGEWITGDAVLPAGIEERLLAAAKPAGLADELKNCLTAARWTSPALEDEEIRAIFQEMENFHASRLERYAGCHFRYLVEEHLLPAPMELDTYFIDRGTIAHEVLARFIRETKSHVALCDADAAQQEMLREKMRQLVDEELDRFGIGNDADGQLLRFTLKQSLDGFIDGELRCCGTLRPDEIELSFGGAADVAGAINLGEGLTLSGRIDRVDRETDSDRALVIDYKTGAGVARWAEYEKKKLVQIPLYMLAIEAAGYKPIGGEYYSLTGNQRRGFYLADCQPALGRAVTKSDLVSRETFDLIIAGARERALVLAKGIRDMDFRAGPQDESDCDRCGYDIICRRRKVKRGAGGG